MGDLSNKKHFVYLLVSACVVLGGSVPFLFGVQDPLSGWVVLGSAVGLIVGIVLSVKLVKHLD